MRSGFRGRLSARLKSSIRKRQGVSRRHYVSRRRRVWRRHRISRRRRVSRRTLGPNAAHNPTARRPRELAYSCSPSTILLRDHSTHSDSTNHALQSSLTCKTRCAEIHHERLLFSEMMEFSLTMPVPNDVRRMPEKSSGTCLALHAARHIRAASTPLPAPRLDDHASTEPRCVLSPHTLRQTTHLVKILLNFPQKFARQFDGNVVFSRYLATIFAAFVRGRHNAAILAEHQRLLFSASRSHAQSAPYQLGVVLVLVPAL